MAAEGAEPPGVDDDAPERALLLLLQHKAGHDQAVVCKLLATSNATRSAVASHCSGQLAVTCAPTPDKFCDDVKNQSFQAWLLNHSGLLKALRVDAYASGGSLLDNTRMHVALSRAVKLESFGSSWHDNTSTTVLSALPATLTELQVVLTEFEPEWGQTYRGVPIYSEEEGYELEEQIMMEQMEGLDYIPTKHDNARMVAALQRFTGLTSLAIDGDVSLRNDSPVMQSLSGLTALTRLSVSAVLPDLKQLRHVPGQLVELELRIAYRHSERMTFGSLGHLTALTCLHTDSGVVVEESDALPPNLVRLCVQCCESLQPLLPLESLRQLTLGRDTTDDQVQAVKGSLSREVDVRTVSKGGMLDKPDCHCYPVQAVQA